MKKLRSAFITGILVIVPLLATIDLLLWFIRTIDNTARNYLFFLPFDFRGLGLIIGIAIIFTVGTLTQNFIGNWFISLLDAAIKKIPIGGGIYSAIKKFLETVFNPRSDQFKGVVLVPFPREGMYSLGFRTGVPDAHISKKFGNEKLANVFVPCTPNPTSGFYLIVPEKELIPLDISVQEAFKIAISMGIVTLDDDAKPA